MRDRDQEITDFENEKGVSASERVERLTTYITSEIAQRKRTFSPAKINRSKEYFTIIKKLCECAGKTEADFDKLKADSSEQLDDILDGLNVDSFESLTNWAAKVKKEAENLVSIQTKGKSSITYSEFKVLVRLKELKEKKAKPNLMAVMTLFAQDSSNDFQAKDLILEFLEIIHPNDIIRLYRMLLLTLAPKRAGNEDSSSGSDSETKAQAESKSTSTNTDTAKLLDQIDDLKTELESTYIRLNSSEENLERLQQEGAETALITVLTQMNSRQAGMLLDQFSKSEEKLKGLSVPPELSGISMCVRMFMRTMREMFGISQVYNIGDIINITLEQSENYDYSGSDFNNGEVKKVQVISPGWKRNGEIFSVPHVIEYAD